MRYNNQNKKYFYLKSEGFFNPNFFKVDSYKDFKIKLLTSNRIYDIRMYSYGLNLFSSQGCKLLWNYFLVSAVRFCRAIMNEVINIFKNYNRELQGIKLN
jgi:hypothetical protein